MSFPSQTPPNAEQSQPHPTDNFAETLQIFWLKNRNAILTCCTVVLFAIAAKGGYDIYLERRLTATAEAYAAAGTSMDKLKEFVASHEGNMLSGVALLRIADEAYSAGKFADARTSYEKALPALKGSPFLDRARLGSAMALLQDGRATEGETALRAISSDAVCFKGVRAEAAYHLAILFSESGRPDEAQKQIDQVLQSSPNGMWAQRAVQLRGSLPAPTASMSPSADSALLAPAGMTLPGK